MAIRHQNAGVSGSPYTATRHYHGGVGASISKFSTAPSPEVDARKGRCVATTQKGRECNAFHTTTSNMCVNHEAQAAQGAAGNVGVSDAVATDS